jgi:hypothetical protein
MQTHQACHAAQIQIQIVSIVRALLKSKDWCVAEIKHASGIRHQASGIRHVNQCRHTTPHSADC